MFEPFMILGRPKYGCSVMTDGKLKELVKLIPNDEKHGIVLTIDDLETLVRCLRQKKERLRW